MYPRISWEKVMDTTESAEHAMGITVLQYDSYNDDCTYPILILFIISVDDNKLQNQVRLEKWHQTEIILLSCKLNETITYTSSRPMTLLAVVNTIKLRPAKLSTHLSRKL